MSQIHIRRKHALGHRQARKTVEKLAKKISSEYNAKYHWKEDKLIYKSTGVNGKLHVSNDEVEIKVNPGIMLRPLKTKIENGIVAPLDALLSDSGTTA